MGAMTIKEALGTLNPSDDSQWTADGLPRMEVIETLVGDKSIKRKDVTEANPEFCQEWLIEQLAQIKADVDKANEGTKDDPIPEVQGRETQAQGQVNVEEKLRDEILAVSQEIETLVSEEAEVGKHKDELITYLRLLQQKTAKQHSPSSDTIARMAFIRSQAEQRAKRYEKGRRIMAVIGKDGINPQSRLDQAMRRKTARGTRRPPARISRR